MLRFLPIVLGSHWNRLLERLPPRSASAHKGFFGNVLVVGGDYGFAGAAAMAAESALRCGAGLVQVATRPEHVSALVSSDAGGHAQGLSLRATNFLLWWRLPMCWWWAPGWVSPPGQ